MTTFEEWYKSFLRERLTKQEKAYLKYIPKNSVAGKLYVKLQKENLKKAFKAGQINPTFMSKWKLVGN